MIVEAGAPGLGAPSNHFFHSEKPQKAQRNVSQRLIHRTASAESPAPQTYLKHGIGKHCFAPRALADDGDDLMFSWSLESPRPLLELPALAGAAHLDVTGFLVPFLILAHTP